MSNEKLEPCPFCDATPIDHGDLCCIELRHKEGCFFERTEWMQHHRLERWNTRPPQPQPVQDDRKILQVIDERDAAEQALSQAYYLVTGRSPEWSNNFGHSHALEEIQDALTLFKLSVKDKDSLRKQLEQRNKEMKGYQDAWYKDQPVIKDLRQQVEAFKRDGELLDWLEKINPMVHCAEHDFHYWGTSDSRKSLRTAIAQAKGRR